MPSNWRQATPLERREWARWVDYYEGPVTRAIVVLQQTAAIAGDTQNFLYKHGLTSPIVFTEGDATRVSGALRIYNTIGRVITGVHSARYGIRLTAGDIDVLAPPDMPPEEWQADTLGAIPLIIWAIVAGGLVVAGLWAGASMLESSAEKDATRYKRAILEADKAIMKQPADVRADWIRRRKDFESQIAKTKEQTGVLVDIFGSKWGGAIAAVGIGLLVLTALRFLPKGGER